MDGEFGLSLLIGLLRTGEQKSPTRSPSTSPSARAAVGTRAQGRAAGLKRFAVRRRPTWPGAPDAWCTPVPRHSWHG